MPGTTPVSVDRDFARFGSKSYAINKINSVDVKSRHPHSQTMMFVWGLLSLGSVLLILNPPAGEGTSPLVLGIAALLFGYLAYRAYRGSKIVEYQLYLTTSSQEIQAIASRDREFVQGLRARIEGAMAGQQD